MNEKTIISQLPAVVLAVWVLAPRLLPWWQAWLKSRATATAPSAATDAAHNSQPQPQPQRGESWGVLVADGAVLVFALWRMAALSLSDAPATVATVMQGAALGGALVICSLRKA